MQRWRWLLTMMNGGSRFHLPLSVCIAAGSALTALVSCWAEEVVPMWWRKWHSLPPTRFHSSYLA